METVLREWDGLPLSLLLSLGHTHLPNGGKRVGRKNKLI